MTEVEWLACTDMSELLEFLQGKASDRKLLLFAVACCRRIWPFLHPSQSQRVVELVEQIVDCPTEGDDLQEASLNARAYADSDEGRSTEIGCSAAYAAASITEKYSGEQTAWIACRTADCVRNTIFWIAYEAASAQGSIDELAKLAGESGEFSEEAVQIKLLREICGNPFRPITLDSRWQTSTVIDLARSVNEQRAFDRMSVLGDALMDAGCDNADILNHCRQDGEHVRGCWVLDLLTGRK